MSYVEVFIDPDDGRSLVEQVYAQVRSAIVEGRLAAGDMLTPTRTLAGQLGLSRFTVTEAYGRLVAQGSVEGRRSQGTFVTSDIESRSFAERVDSAMRPRAVVAEMRSFADPVRRAPPRFDLRAGRPDLALFPLRAWRRCTTAALQATPPNYGDPVGDPNFEPCWRTGSDALAGSCPHRPTLSSRRAPCTGSTSPLEPCSNRARSWPSKNRVTHRQSTSCASAATRSLVCRSTRTG